MWTTWGPGKVSSIERCPHFRVKKAYLGHSFPREFPRLALTSTSIGRDSRLLRRLRAEKGELESHETPEGSEHLLGTGAPPTGAPPTGALPHQLL